MRDLLKDPGEIWRHASERELTDAGRSLLLAIWSLNGGASMPRLQEAFSVLHVARAKRYGFQRGANDFVTAMRELEGSFVRQTNDDTVKVLDPSVLDLVNTILIESPDNALDLVAGAVGFHQIVRIWTMGQFDMTNAIEGAMVGQAGLVADAIERRMLLEHVRIEPDGTKTYVGMQFEVRLANLVRIAKRLQHSAFLDLVDRLNSRLAEELDRRNICIDVAGARDVMQALDSGRWPEANEWRHIRMDIKDRLIESIRVQTNVSELREVCEALNFDGPDRLEKELFVRAFKGYLSADFEGALEACTSSEHYQLLVDDLFYVQSMLGVAADREMECAEIAQKEFEARGHVVPADSPASLRVLPGDDPSGEAQVRSMFSSLTADR